MTSSTNFAPSVRTASTTSSGASEKPGVLAYLAYSNTSFSRNTVSLTGALYVGILSSAHHGNAARVSASAARQFIYELSGRFARGNRRLARRRSSRRASLGLALHRSGRAGVGLLPIDAPVAEFVQRDRLSGDGATHEGARSENSKIPVEKFDFRFARVGGTSFDPVHERIFPSSSLYAMACAAREP